MIALADASTCEVHVTGPLCSYCWKDHWLRIQQDAEEPIPLSDQCWALLPFDWDAWLKRSALER